MLAEEMTTVTCSAGNNVPNSHNLGGIIRRYKENTGLIMSRRRGQPSSDPKIIERREWYEMMEAQAFESRQRLEDAASVAMSDIHDMEKLMIDTSYDPDSIERVISRMSTGEASAEVSPAHAEPIPLTRGGSFSSLALTLGEESMSRRESAKSASNFEFERIDKFKVYPDYILDRCLLRLNNPKRIEHHLVCLDGFGNNAMRFRRLAVDLSRVNVAVYSIILPGYMDRVNDDFITSAVGIADHIITTLLHHSVTSIFLLGQSIGAYAAFEVAREAKKRGSVDVKCLMVVGARAPQIQSQFNRDTKGYKYHTQSDTILCDRLVELGVLPERWKQRRDVLQPYLSGFRNDFRLLEKYHYMKPPGKAKPIDCDIATFSSDEDTSISTTHIYNWAELSDGLHSHASFQSGLTLFWKEAENIDRFIMIVRCLITGEELVEETIIEQKTEEEKAVEQSAFGDLF